MDIDFVSMGLFLNSFLGIFILALFTVKSIFAGLDLFKHV